MSFDDLKVALVHDELIRRGGAEIVFEELARCWPKADVYALYSSNNPVLKVGGRQYPIHTSFLQKFPLWFRRHPGRMLPFLPQAAEQFDFSEYDLVVSSASGFAKGVITRSNVPHVCYCHTPTRYLWSESHEVAAGRGTLLKMLQHYLRMADYAAAQRPSTIIANSTYTQDRIWTYYRRESEVVYPPVDTSFYTPILTPRVRMGGSKGYFLCVGRLTPTKHFEQAVSVCEKLRLPLMVVGTGSEMGRLRQAAGKYTTFTGKISREQLREYYRGARALLQPGVEDFGMATVEALACGTPVIALGQGGVTEIVDHRQHGILYSSQREEYLSEAVRQFLDCENDFLVNRLQERALRFSVNRFRQNILDIVAKVAG